MSNEIRIDGYNSQAAPVNPPAAAIFNKGATNEAGIREAADRRREHSKKLGEGYKPEK